MSGWLQNLSFLVADDAKESWVCPDGGVDYGAGDWGEHGDLQRGACGAAGASAVSDRGPGDAGVAYASAGELSGDDAVFGVGGELSGLAEAEPCLREDGAVLAAGSSTLRARESRRRSGGQGDVRSSSRCWGASRFMGGCFSRAGSATGSGFLNDHEVVLSYKYWQTHYGADASVVGRTINLDGEPYTIVGVMGAGDDEAGVCADMGAARC